MSLCIGLIYQARTLVRTRHLLSTMSDLWALKMLSAASKVGHVLICEACVAVRFCQRKDGLSYLVIGQLWIKPCTEQWHWHREVSSRDSPSRESRYRGLCPAHPPLSLLCPGRKYIKIGCASVYGCIQDAVHSHWACVQVQGGQAAGNRPGGQRGVTLDQLPGPSGALTGVIQVSAVSVSDESKTRNIFPQSRNYTGKAFKPISVYVTARSLGLSIPLLAFAKVSLCTPAF